MKLLESIKNLFSVEKYPLTEFGMDDMQFFVALLRASPEGSRLGFDQSEPESFVHAFREWSHRERPDSFEADYYSIEPRFIAGIEREIASGKLKLYAHFWIVAPDGRTICSSLDDFTVVTLDDETRKKIQNTAADVGLRGRKG